MLYEQQCLLFLEYVSFEMVRNLNCDYMVIHVLRENSNMTRLSRNNQQDATLY